MVAENSIVWRVSGVLESSVMTSGRKPRSSISSASSRTSACTCDQVERAAVGQVDQATGGADDDVDAGLEGLELRVVADAAVDRSTRRPRSLLARWRSLETWSASSRVGATMSACGLPAAGRRTPGRAARRCAAAPGCRRRGSCRCPCGPGR